MRYAGCRAAMHRRISPGSRSEKYSAVRCDGVNRPCAVPDVAKRSRLERALRNAPEAERGGWRTYECLAPFVHTPHHPSTKVVERRRKPACGGVMHVSRNTTALGTHRIGGLGR
jgi:hypothetical protein